MLPLSAAAKITVTPQITSDPVVLEEISYAWEEIQDKEAYANFARDTFYRVEIDFVAKEQTEEMKDTLNFARELLKPTGAISNLYLGKDRISEIFGVENKLYFKLYTPLELEKYRNNPVYFLPGTLNFSKMSPEMREKWCVGNFPIVA